MRIQPNIPFNPVGPDTQALVRSIALAWTLGAALTVQAQQPQAGVPAATGGQTRFAISGYELSGDIPLSDAETAKILAPYLGPQSTLATLQQATAALEAALKQRGYTLHRVALPAQELGGKVRLSVVRFVIGKVVVQGQSQFSQANIRASLPELQEGGTPNFQTLAVQTAIANENPAKQVQVTVKESDEADKIDAAVQVKESKPWNLTLNLANPGNNATGNDRITLALSHANVMDADHQLSAAYTTSAERSDAVRQLGLSYRIPLYRQGAVLGLGYTYSDVVGNFGSFTSTGAGQTFSANLSLYRVPQGGLRSYWTLAIDDKTFNATKLNGAAVPGQVDRNSRPLALGYAVRSESDTAIWSADAQWALNLTGGPGNDLTSYRVEDQRIATAQWQALRGNLSYLAPLPGGWLWNARAQWQYSPHALISGEQLGLGGATSVRGTADRAISGDSGIGLSLELSSHELSPGLRAHAFVDGGVLSSNNTAASTALKASSDQLASVGLGLRFGSGALQWSAEWGQVVTAATQPPGGNPGLPRLRDEKFHLSLTARF